MKFFSPANLDDLEDAVALRQLLQLVCHEVDELTIESWTRAERLVAYDYAMRTHVHVAARSQSASASTELRPCPSFVIAGDVYRAKQSLWWQLVSGERRVAS